MGVAEIDRVEIGTFWEPVWNEWQPASVHQQLSHHAVERTVWYLDKVPFESLPILPMGTCVFAGAPVNIPMVESIGGIVPKFEPHIKPTILVGRWVIALPLENCLVSR